MDRTPTHNIQLCSAVCSQARNASHAPNSHGLQCHLCTPENSSVIWCRTCLTFCCSLTCRLPRANHLPHALFLPPRHKNTQHNRDDTIISKNTQYVMNSSRLSQSTSSAMKKNHSGVKTCRVAETRATLLPHLARHAARSSPIVVQFSRQSRNPAMSRECRDR